MNKALNNDHANGDVHDHENHYVVVSDTPHSKRTVWMVGVFVLLLIAVVGLTLMSRNNQSAPSDQVSQQPMPSSAN